MKLALLFVALSAQAQIIVVITPEDNWIGKYQQFTAQLCNAGDKAQTYAPAEMRRGAEAYGLHLATNAGLLLAAAEANATTPQRRLAQALELVAYVYTGLEAAGALKVKEIRKWGPPVAGSIRFGLTLYPARKIDPVPEPQPGILTTQPGECSQAELWGIK